ncbi:hypothetical protein ESO86_18500, partial [Agromyces binzhouensis]
RAGGGDRRRARARRPDRRPQRGRGRRRGAHRGVAPGGPHGDRAARREPGIPAARPHQRRPAHEPGGARRRRAAGGGRGVPRRLGRRLIRSSASGCRIRRTRLETPRSGGADAVPQVCCCTAAVRRTRRWTAWKTPGRARVQGGEAVTRPLPPVRPVR